MIDFDTFVRRFDRLRAIPRIAVGFYLWGSVELFSWFTALPDPTAAQSAFVSTFAGAGSVFFGLYFNSGAKWNEE